MLDSKISTLETKIDGAIATQDVKIKVLQTKCEQYEEDIAALKSIVSKQQRSLNSIDDEERSKNLIITGISENDIVDGRNVCKNDTTKLKGVFNCIGSEVPEGSTWIRIGKQKEGYNRPIKMTMRTKADRDSVKEKAKALKEEQAPWNNIYINKDLSPAVVAENNRLRQKMKKLKQLDENKDKEIKIVKGELKVNGNVVDKNVFFQ